MNSDDVMTNIIVLTLAYLLGGCFLLETSAVLDFAIPFSSLVLFFSFNFAKKGLPVISCARLVRLLVFLVRVLAVGSFKISSILEPVVTLLCDSSRFGPDELVESLQQSIVLS